MADANGTDKDGVELEPVVVIEGLKTKHKEIIKRQASGHLTPTDWHVIKATEVESYSVSSAITFLFSELSAAERFTEITVFPTPPLADIIPIFVIVYYFGLFLKKELF